MNGDFAAKLSVPTESHELLGVYLIVLSLINGAFGHSVLGDVGPRDHPEKHWGTGRRNPLK